MALTDEQRKDMVDGLGIPEGKTLAEMIADILNGTLNSYDKRKTGELEKMLGSLKLPEGLAESVAKLVEAAEKKVDPEPEPKDGDKPDLSKLPTWARTMFEGLEKANKNLQTQFNDEKTAREARDKTLEEKDAQTAERSMYDAAVAAAVAKDGGGLDPTRMTVLLPYLKDQGLIRPVEDKPGVYEMNTGELDPIHSDPVYKPLGEAMKHFSGTEMGKTFRAARPGTTTTTPGGDETPIDRSELRTIESFNGDMEAIRKAADAGLIDVGQG
jgi:hypothetical protein